MIRYENGQHVQIRTEKGSVPARYIMVEPDDFTKHRVLVGWGADLSVLSIDDNDLDPVK